MSEKLYFVKINSKAYIGNDLMVADYNDVFSHFSPEPFTSLREANNAAEKYGGVVVRFFDSEVGNEKICKYCQHSCMGIRACDHSMPIAVTRVCLKNEAKEVKDDETCDEFRIRPERT